MFQFTFEFLPTYEENAMQSRELYKAKINAELSRIRADIDKLKAKAKRVEADQAITFNKYVSAIEDKSETIGSWLDELQSDSEEARRVIERGVKEAWNRLDIATNAAKARFDS